MSAQRAWIPRAAPRVASDACARPGDADNRAARAPRVVLLTGNALATNPRAVKEADALARAGFDVEVLGAWLTPLARTLDRPLVAAARFRFTPVIDLGDASLGAAA